MKNNKNKKFWQFKAAAEDKPAELLLYGHISSVSWWDDEVTPKQFKKDLDDLGDVEEISVFVNSGGGDVFAGQAIYSMLKRHKATINVYIDGLAASIASVVAMAGDTIYMPKNAMMMIHNPYTFAFGDSSEFRKMADTLDQVREGIITTYLDKTGMDKQEIIDLMDAETWMTAEEAVEYGFADELEAAKQVAASIKDNLLIMNGQEFDLRKFQNPPKMEHLPVLDGKPPEQRPQDQQILTMLNEIKSILNEGKTLSSANEDRLKQARGLLDEVLDQLPEDPEDNTTTLINQQPDQGLLSLYQAQVQLNKNKLRRNANV